MVLEYFAQLSNKSLKMKKSALIFILSFPISFLFYTCTDCPPFPAKVLAHFDVKGIKLNVSVKGDPYKLPYKKNTKISTEQFSGLEIHYLVDYVAQHQKAINPVFGNPLFACDLPAPGHDGAKSEKISDLHIITMFDLNDSMKSGTDLTHWFTTYSDLLEEFVRLSEFPALDTGIIPQEIMNINANITADPLREYMQWKVELTLNNGEQYSAISDTIFLK